MNKEKLKQDIIKTENKLAELKQELESDSIKDGLLDVPELGLEIEIEVTHKGKSYDKIMALPEVREKIKKGWRLLCPLRPVDYVNELAFLENNPTYSKILKLDGSSTKDDFFVNQIFKRNAEKGYVAYFYAGSGGSDLYSYGDSSVADSVRGVRLCRKISKGKKK
jgi:IS4 transposase